MDTSVKTFNPFVLEKLQENETLTGLDKGCYEWLMTKGEERTLKEGDYLFTKGMATNHLHIVLDGSISVFIDQGNQSRLMATLEKGTITGVLPYSRMTAAQGNGVATRETCVLSIHRDDFPDMISNHMELTTRFVHLMTSRVRDFTKLHSQNDKMMALGKLSAGLAHELNNPAAAVIRSSGELKKHLAYLPEGFKKVISIRMSEEDVDAVNEMLFSHIGDLGKEDLSLMEQTERVDDFVDELEEYNLENVEEIAENMVDFGFTFEDVELVKDKVPHEHVDGVLNWINNVLTTEKLVGEINEASQRISDLVKSVKSYTHMDRASDKELVDIHDGIKNTIAMLGHKLKRASIELVKNFEPDLPFAKVFPGEMNQVWTNIIDNAIDAMEENGGDKLEIRTHKDREFVVIDIIDNGPGISDEDMDNIFDPFYTTKEMGKGTGLGLDVVRRITDQHNGSVKATSKPGETCFSVCIPING